MVVAAIIYHCHYELSSAGRGRREKRNPDGHGEDKPWGGKGRASWKVREQWERRPRGEVSNDKRKQFSDEFGVFYLRENRPRLGGYRASQTWTRLSEEFGARVFHGNRA